MTDTTTAPATMQGRTAHANGIDIHYLDAGDGPPLLLLHGGMVSTNPIWGSAPISYQSSLMTLTQQFRVIAPDTRGCGLTPHTSGTISMNVLADDAAALIRALELSRPAVCGFSEGGVVATILGIRHPESVGAIVNDAGYDMFNPSAPTFAMMRQILGGSPDATQANPDVAAEQMNADQNMRPMFELMKRDQDGGQGEGHWRTYLSLAFNRTTRWPGYTFDDFAAIQVPTLIMAGDRDAFCSPEEAAAAYRRLRNGQLAVMPDTGHLITPEKIEATRKFLQRVSIQTPAADRAGRPPSNG